MKKYFDPELSIVRFADVIITSGDTTKSIGIIKGNGDDDDWEE